MILEPKRVSVRQPTIDDSVKVEPPPAPSAPNKQKKEKLDTNWKNNKYNRLDKGEYDLVFTKVLAKDLKDESFEVELLNSLPDEVLRANGWDEGSISRLQQTGKDKFVPYSVLEALTEKPDEIEQNEKPGRFFGQGGFGKVKFARIWPLGASKPIWCVAKKIKDYSLKYQTLQEVKLQAQAGVGPKVYGSADTVDKNNKKQLIVFMDQARGMQGIDYLLASREGTIASDEEIAQDLILKTKKMHENGVYHRDLKLENLFIDTSDNSVQIIDYGLATEGKHDYNPHMHIDGDAYYAPEFVFGKINGRLGYLDREKSDIYSLGVMLAELFTKEQFSTFKWSVKTLRNQQEMIERQIDSMVFPDRNVKRLIRRMVDANPASRPDLTTVLKEFKQIVDGSSWEPVSGNTSGRKETTDKTESIKRSNRPISINLGRQPRREGAKKTTLQESMNENDSVQADYIPNFSKAFPEEINPWLEKNCVNGEVFKQISDYCAIFKDVGNKVRKVVIRLANDRFILVDSSFVIELGGDFYLNDEGHQALRMNKWFFAHWKDGVPYESGEDPYADLHELNDAWMVPAIPAN